MSKDADMKTDKQVALRTQQIGSMVESTRLALICAEINDVDLTVFIIREGGKLRFGRTYPEQAE